ncbi:alpha/beta fold hydrolase [Paractinoplanes lichenicola]|uniref:Alpha/beta hydrolase n=1 Tax=Paractinoplanes lichenicola TaxID=2802976 RepID=A0ABS1VVS4_9ACTN|nr:alpha/beta fold hydrolase [Actinoplanes lichenicola]MBL7258550.1 alpha/beta hydrolase [Actinoplanes lichenicola]
MTLVLLHPLGVDHRFWDPVRPYFQPSVVTPDLSGATIEEMAAAVSLPGPVDLCGVSLGGLVAQVIAARHPSLVRRLILADTVAVYPPAMREMWRSRAALVRAEGLTPILAPTEKLWFTEAAQPSDVSRIRALLLSGDPDVYARTCEALAAADTTALVPEIKAPTLLLCGKHDAPPFHQAVDYFTATLPDPTVTWLPGAHATAYEHPAPFADAVAAFLC